LTDEEQDQIDDLLTPEIRRTSEPHEYVDTLPPPPSSTPFWSQEYARLEQSIPLNAITTTAYAQPSSSIQALVAKEFLTNRTDNLALLEKYGGNAWLVGNAAQEHSLGLLEKELAEAKEEATRINRERKAQNLEAGAQLDSLQGRWRKALRGIMEVEIANALLEEEVRELESKTQ
jgi:pre-mRNA-splicing factor SPF27